MIRNLREFMSEIAPIVICILLAGAVVVVAVTRKPEAPKVHNVEGHLYLTYLGKGLVHAEHCPCKR